MNGVQTLWNSADGTLIVGIPGERLKGNADLWRWLRQIQGRAAWQRNGRGRLTTYWVEIPRHEIESLAARIAP